MIRAEPITEAEAKRSRGIMDLAPRRGNLYDFDPRLLKVESGWNSRIVTFDPANEEDLALACSIAEVGVKQPLTVYMKDGEPTVTDGHRRLAATLYAIDTLKAEIKAIPVQTEAKHASEADRVLSQLVRNQGKPLAPIEKASVYAKLTDLGWKVPEIAKKVGASAQHVTELLTLRAGPAAVVEMVKAGEVSAGLAMSTLRDKRGDGTAATAALYEGLKRAQSEGKSKATAKHVERPAPDLTKSVGYQAGLKRAVEIARRAGQEEVATMIEAEMTRCPTTP